MSTNSSICMLSKDGKVKEIYCHWDGYMEHNGTILAKHYTDPKKVKELISLGALSFLGEEIIDKIVEKYGFDYRYNPEAQKEFSEEELNSYKSTVAYHRDRGEDLEIFEYNNINDFLKSIKKYGVREFTYLFVESEAQWYLLEYYKCPKPELNARKIYLNKRGNAKASKDFVYFFLDENYDSFEDALISKEN